MRFYLIKNQRVTIFLDTRLEMRGRRKTLGFDTPAEMFDRLNPPVIAVIDTAKSTDT
ncbi:hypothetical protein CLU84_3982 [Comamonas sp. 26]|nr:hypothetical protein CLU84_3982 [Comamonas sp. 26]